MSEQVVYLMRGLPCCGKSTTARELAGDDGVICETDEFFYTQVGDDPLRYDYDEALMPKAREWNLARFEQALRDGRAPVIVDRGNGLNEDTRRYVLLADRYKYQVELREPDSPWWQELRVLLKYKDFIDGRLFDQWATALAARSKENHRVPTSTIRRWMNGWRHDITVDQIRNS